MPEPDDHAPDPAALDELLKAFGGGHGGAAAPDASPSGVEPASDAGDGVAPGDVGSEPAEIFIVEQEPLQPAGEPTPPTIIRIDDYGGSAVVDRPVGTSPVPTESAPPSVPSDAPDAPDAPGGGGERAVIDIEDDELPDAVYVRGDLQASGNRTIVFIEDDDTGDTIAPDVERDVRRGIEPRLRERRAAVKRAIGRKRLRWLVLGTLVIVIVVGALALLGSGLFAIDADNVEVYGAVYADPERIDAVVDDLVGTPTLRADTSGAEQALEAIPWVDEARVRVSFPNSATIEIREREAWTTYQGPDQRYRVLDREGRVLAVLDGYPIAYLLLAGPDAVDLDPGDFAPQGYAAASELAKNLTPSIRGQVAYVSVTADGSRLSIFLDDGTEVRFGAARDMFNKLLRLETTLANNPDREPGVIDVSTSEVTL
jgi:cell division protein FtsQ